MNFKVAEDMTRMQISLASSWLLGHGNECVQVNDKGWMKDGKDEGREGSLEGRDVEKKSGLFESCPNRPLC